ncbi:hypothetical protein EI94DRAFT_1704311 [Lactarius quietus]|nr:hypothetical protein EI94DRAFT_1704311 [Lactarius quietus]
MAWNAQHKSFSAECDAWQKILDSEQRYHNEVTALAQCDLLRLQNNYYKACLQAILLQHKLQQGNMNNCGKLVIVRGNPWVKTLYPYPYPANTLPVPLGMGFVPPRVRVSNSHGGGRLNWIVTAIVVIVVTIVAVTSSSSPSSGPAVRGRDAEVAVQVRLVTRHASQVVLIVAVAVAKCGGCFAVVVTDHADSSMWHG